MSPLQYLADSLPRPQAQHAEAKRRDAVLQLGVFSKQLEDRSLDHKAQLVRLPAQATPRFTAPNSRAVCCNLAHGHIPTCVYPARYPDTRNVWIRTHTSRVIRGRGGAQGEAAQREAETHAALDGERDRRQELSRQLQQQQSVNPPFTLPPAPCEPQTTKPEPRVRRALTQKLTAAAALFMVLFDHPSCWSVHCYH